MILLPSWLTAPSLPDRHQYSAPLNAGGQQPLGKLRQLALLLREGRQPGLQARGNSVRSIAATRQFGRQQIKRGRLQSIAKELCPGDDPFSTSKCSSTPPQLNRSSSRWVKAGA